MRQPDWKAALDIATVLGLLILLAVVAGSVLAAENPKVSVGKKMPLFQLNDTDGKAHSLASVKGKTAVLIFSSQKCPWSHAADKGLKTLAKEYSAKGVAFFAIDSNRSTSPEELKAYVAKEGIPYPVLKDVENKYADEVGASRTPEFFIVDKDGKVAYHGAYDNRKAPDQTGDINYVRNALEDLLAGKPVAAPEVQAWGCGIKRVPSSPARTTASAT